jgi:RNA polymerase sigma-70 factor (ECF subfamily)
MSFMLAFEDSSHSDLRAVEPNELVRRAHGGCADSFAELSRRFRPRLLHLLERRLGGRPVDAEDVAQEALARAFGRLDQFDARYRFSTWLFTIAIRLASDHARSSRRRLQRVAVDSDACTRAESCQAMPAERSDEVDNLWQVAKSALNDAQFTALWLHYGEDLSPAEVAQVMNRSRVGVRVLLHRARIRLAEAMAAREVAAEVAPIVSIQGRR